MTTRDDSDTRVAVAAPRIPALATILLATDGSLNATLARRAAVDIAVRAGAELHIVSAWRPQLPLFGSPEVAPSELLSYSEEQARHLLEREVREADIPDRVTVTAEPRMGRACDVVVEEAERVGADLVVVGSRGLGRVQRIILGSVADAAVRHCPCPVLVVRDGPEGWPPRRLVVGMNDSPDARQGLETAAALARVLGASIELVGAVSFPRGGAGSGLEPVRHEELDAMRRFLDEERERLVEGGLAVEVTVAHGDAAESLLAAADEPRGPAVIVVGRRGGALRHALLGSVSNAVVHAAPGPVLVAPFRRGAGDPRPEPM